MAVLREVLHLPQLSPLVNNVASAMIMVVFFRCAIEVSGWLRARARFTVLASHCRQVLQMNLATSIVFWPLFDTTDDWSWRLNGVLAAAMSLRMIYKGKLNDPDDIDVRNFTRSGRPSELFFGPLQTCCVMFWLGQYHFMTQEAAILAAAVGVGDGVAPMIGTHFGRHIYRMPLSNKKTMEGSVVGVFLGTVLACYVFLYMMGLEIPPLRYILVYGVVAAVVEGSAPGNFDNAMIALVMYTSLDRIKEWIPA